MQLGMIGLGKMGGNMARRLMRGGHEMVVYDRDPDNVAALEKDGAVGVTSLEEFVKKLTPPRAAWIMVPSGPATEETVYALAELMASDDIIIDGGNSMFKDDVRRATILKPQGIHYVDVGTSGGVWGLDNGYCMMMGGETDVIQHLNPIFKTLAPGPDAGVTPKTDAESGYLHTGPVGSGHFVKMIHNGIEYGMMQAYAEGFEILKQANAEKVLDIHKFELPLHDIAEVWRHGSVIRSWLLDLFEIATREDQNLSNYSGFVQDSGEGRWTVQAAIDEDVPAPVLTTALYTRFRSRESESYADKVLSALRHQFGGHVEQSADK